MSDVTLELSYSERSTLLSALFIASTHIEKNWDGGSLKDKVLSEIDAMTKRASHLRCQPGGCEYCNGESEEL